MKLKEHEGKDLFRRFGIPTPEGFLVRGSDEITEINRPMVVKAQVRIGGRGKAGGIRFGSSVEQVKRAVADVIGMEIGGEKVEEVLVEERVSLDREIYLSIYLDRRSKLPMLMIIGEGGLEVENVDPSLVLTWPLSPFTGMSPYVARAVASEIVMDPEPTRRLADILEKAWDLFWRMDCELLEINPLARTYDGRLLAIDAKVVLDDDALFRHPEMGEVGMDRTSLEAEAAKTGLSLVQLDGDVGVIANGAGLAMATLDVLALHGARGGVFLDLGGTDDEKAVEAALAMMVRAKPRVILVNIFGGITKCDIVAEGIIRAREFLNLDMELVVRMRGVNEVEARAMLKRNGISALHDLDEACSRAAKAGAEGR